MLDLKYRYLAEDVPTGLCFAPGLAESIGIKTPTVDKVLTWVQECIGLERRARFYIVRRIQAPWA